TGTPARLTPLCPRSTVAHQIRSYVMNRYQTALRADTAVLLLVDFQERLMPVIHGSEAVLDAARRLTLAANIFELPVLVSEQYPAGLGRTCGALSECLPGVVPFEKTLFSAC